MFMMATLLARNPTAELGHGGVSHIKPRAVALGGQPTVNVSVSEEPLKFLLPTHFALTV